MAPVTLAARILEQLDRGLSNAEIAAMLGCRDAYVRAVKQRREGKAYAIKATPYAKLSDAAKERQRGRIRSAYHSLSPAERKEVRRQHYAAARLTGATPREAAIEATHAVNRAGCHAMKAKGIRP